MYPEPVEDFFVTQWTDAGWVRGQGYFDLEYPGFNKDYHSVSSHIPVPIITHEIGQHTFYPDLQIIDRYFGSSEFLPVGYMAIKADLEKKGLISIIDKYINASGKLQTLLYKEEIERALKTYGVSGFQLLGIRDGGGNPIGVLNDFWEPKAYVDSTQFRQFCSELVPMAWFEKAVFANSEKFEVEFGAANFKQPVKNRKLICELSDNSGNVLQHMELAVPELFSGKTEKYGRFEFDLTKVRSPGQFRLSVMLEGTDYFNSWPIWVYPDIPAIEDDQIVVTSSFLAAEKALNEGRKVLLSPPLERIKGNPGRFSTVFWSPTHFGHWERVSREGTMGLLIDPKHTVFTFFPTEFHSNWQWWDLCKRSVTLEYDGVDIQPLIKVIDNYYNNRRLTTLFEVQVGNGKLIFSSIDLISDLDVRIEARQLRHSLLHYMRSNEFAPQDSITMQQIRKKFEIEALWMYPGEMHTFNKHLK